MVLQPSTTSAPPNTRLTIEEINRELEQKRKALDEEIRRFTAEKNAEFEAFEKEIKGQLEELSTLKAQPTSSDEASVIERGFSVDKPYEAPFQPITGDNQSHQTSLQSPQATPLNSVPMVYDFAKQPIEARPQLRLASRRKDRGFELDALFVPSYLPLLDSTFTQQDYRKALSNNDERISSSLNIESQAPEIERPILADRRLSSSPINTGPGNKKSSLRRSAGSDSPRERKHVLFSIDDRVVSPNASPENLRIGPSATPVLSVPDLHSNRTTIAGLEAATQLALMGPWTQTLPPISPTRTYKDLVEPTVVTPPEELEKEDLHLNTRDPLFDSDEPPLPFEEEEWQQSPPDSGSSDEEEFIATSPHVSSVPIQILQRSKR